jgi:tRNA(adenine34) deaminase
MTDQKANHDYWMSLALGEARQALTEDEVPIGAILVRDNQIVAADHNRTRQTSDPLAHAEKLIIDRIMAHKIKYLQEYSLYVTLEPCLMCAGMMIWARLGLLVFGASDPKAGAVGSIYNVLNDKSFNHKPDVLRGVLGVECSELLKNFFMKKRK